MGNDKLTTERVAGDLWTKIVAVAKEKDISYREATEIAVKEYWIEHQLDKKP